MSSQSSNHESLSAAMQRIQESRLHVFITFFVPPEASLMGIARDFIGPRLRAAYFKSFVRLMKYGHRGHMPWKKDVMTQIRRQVEVSRFFYLNNVISTILKMPFSEVFFYIHTNSELKADEIKKIWKMSNVKVFVHPEYDKVNFFHNSPWETGLFRNPWYLTWEHKKSLREAASRSSKNDLFLCLEDDLLFTLENMIYFLRYLGSLKELNFIPSFLRTEWSFQNNNFVAIDLSRVDKKLKFENLPKIELTTGECFVELPNSYSSVILLDYDLVREYVSSDAFEEAKSRHLVWWDIGARATMGLQFLNVPAGFSTRHLVPLNRWRTGIAQEAWVSHQPNIYSQKLEFSESVTPQDFIH